MQNFVQLQLKIRNTGGPYFRRIDLLYKDSKTYSVRWEISAKIDIKIILEKSLSIDLVYVKIHFTLTAEPINKKLSIFTCYAIEISDSILALQDLEEKYFLSSKQWFFRYPSISNYLGNASLT